MTIPSFVLSAHKLKKVYPGPEPLEVLKEISLEVAAGDTIAIMGKSGSGKSTLLSILGTLESPTEGDMEICGKKATPSQVCSLRNQHIGFIFQSFHLMEDYTLLENVLMPAHIARLPVHKTSPAYHRALQLLQQVGLLPKAHLLTKFLSGGEKQRAALARALCNNPDLILADEPTGNLDPTSSALVQELLLGCTRQHKKTLILVTHDQDLASLCDKIFHLKDGILHRIK